MPNNLRKSCYVGAAAGVMPLLVSFISVDAELILENFAPLIAAGYVIKSLGLMILGAFVVYVNSELDYKKAFQLGIMAPALVIGTMNANSLNKEKAINEYFQNAQNNQILSTDTPVNSGWNFSDKFEFSLLNTAYAAETDPLIGKHNKPSSGKLLWYGISGSLSESWFVIVGSHKDEAKAQTQAEQLLSKGYDARVFPPFGKNEYYAVAIGSYVEIDEAKMLKYEAIKGGLAKDSYLWRWKN